MHLHRFFIPQLTYCPTAILHTNHKFLQKKRTRQCLSFVYCQSEIIVLSFDREAQEPAGPICWCTHTHICSFVL